MKIFPFIAAASLFLFSCGGGNNASSLAQEVCECYKKANGMDAADPNRPKAQDECIKKQGEGWAKIKDDVAKAGEFNKIIGDCGKELIQSSIPK